MGLKYLTVLFAIVAVSLAALYPEPVPVGAGVSMFDVYS